MKTMKKKRRRKTKKRRRSKRRRKRRKNWILSVSKKRRRKMRKRKIWRSTMTGLNLNQSLNLRLSLVCGFFASWKLGWA